MKGIIFDFDNTLVKSHIDFPAMKIALAHKLKEVNIDLGPEGDIPTKFTAGNIIDEAEKYDSQNGTNLKSVLWQLVEDFERKGMENLDLEKDVRVVLDFLITAGIKVALLTNNAKKPTLEVLEQYNLYDYFSLIVAREDITRMKPDKEGIDHILKNLDLSHDEVILVGDSWVDGKAAHNANVRFVLYRSDLLDAEKYGIVIWKHITTMKELLSLLNQQS